MKTIPLTQGKSASVDGEDFSTLSPFNWIAQKTKDGKFFAVRMTTAAESVKQTAISMHRHLAFGYAVNPFPVAVERSRGLRVFHEDGDSLNNSRSNIKVYASSTHLGTVPSDLVIVPRKKRLPAGLFAAESGERILYARGFGRDQIKGFLVATNGGYRGPYQSWEQAVEEFSRIYHNSPAPALSFNLGQPAVEARASAAMDAVDALFPDTVVEEILGNYPFTT